MGCVVILSFFLINLAMSIVTVKFQVTQEEIKEEKLHPVVIPREDIYKILDLKRLKIYQKIIIAENEEYIAKIQQFYGVDSLISQLQAEKEAKENVQIQNDDPIFT